ncbi:aspartic peptidase domain-containing protein [Xylariaceae sp. FL1651]|nr:aspartic peptidase domain-containing protein [Xylariaceae sp. FL1651]
MVCSLIASLSSLVAVLPLVGAHVVLELARHQRHKDSAGISRRVDPVGVHWQEDGFFYTTQIKLGTPGQAITVEINTVGIWGDTNIFVPATNSPVCLNTSSIYGGCWLGSFNQNQSSTFDLLRGGGGPAADIFIDVVNFGGVNVTDIVMVQGKNISSNDVEILVTPTLCLLNAPGVNPIPSVLDQLVFQGHVATIAFSLWLEDTENSAGQLMLGAIDTTKFDEPLVSIEAYGQTAPTFPEQSGSWPDGLRLLLTSIYANSSTGMDALEVSEPIPVAMDFRTAITLPQQLVLQIWKIAGVSQHIDSAASNETIGVIDCSQRDSEGTFTFGLGGSEGVRVTVDMRSLVFLPTYKTRDEINKLGEDLCIFAVGFDSGPHTWRLGVPFWRSIYAVVDLHNSKVAIAPTRQNASDEESTVVSFSGQGAPIPSATLAPNQPTSPTAFPNYPFTASVFTTDKAFCAEEGFKTLTNTMPTPTTTATKAALISSAQLSTGTKVGIGVALSVVVIVFVVIGGLLWRRLRKKRKDTEALSVQAQEEPGSEKPELAGDAIDAIGTRSPQPKDSEAPGELSHVSEIFELPSGINLPVGPRICLSAEDGGRRHDLGDESPQEKSSVS